MNERENMLRTVRFECPEWIPVAFQISSGCWDFYPQDALEGLMAKHPFLFPGFEQSTQRIVPEYAPWRVAGQPYTDSWGCVWKTVRDGFTGAVVHHALADWEDLASYSPPSPEMHNGWSAIDWEAERRRLAEAHAAGRLAAASLRHGHTFLTMTYLRGYANVIVDMCGQEPRLNDLLEMIEAFNLALVRRYIDARAEWVGYPEDLGMQQGPMLSPDLFRRYIKPSYERLVAPARAAGCIIHMHSDGDLRELAADLLDVGIDVINLQDLVNGLDWIQANLKGRICIDLDIDRGHISRFGTPEAIHAHIRRVVECLGDPAGGLMLRYGLYPGVPLDNIAALMDALDGVSL